MQDPSADLMVTATVLVVQAWRLPLLLSYLGVLGVLGGSIFSYTGCPTTAPMHSATRSTLVVDSPATLIRPEPTA
jgi:hypothetical protein